MGEDPSNLDKILTRNTPPTLANLVDLARALRCSTADLWPPQDFSRGEPSHASWRKFRESDLGRSMEPHEVTELARVRLLFRAPEPSFYVGVLLAYRGHTTALQTTDARPSSLPPPGA